MHVGTSNNSCSSEENNTITLMLGTWVGTLVGTYVGFLQWCHAWI